MLDYHVFNYFSEILANIYRKLSITLTKKKKLFNIPRSPDIKMSMIGA